MDKLKFVILTLFWNRILNRYNEVSKTVQRQYVYLSVVISLLHSLHLFSSKLRDEFSSFELKAKAIATDANYACRSTCRKRKRSVLIPRFESPAPDTVLTGGEKSELTHLPVNWLSLSGAIRQAFHL